MATVPARVSGKFRMPQNSRKPAPLRARDVWAAIMQGHLPPMALRRLRPRFTNQAEFSAAMTFADSVMRQMAREGRSLPSNANPLPTDPFVPDPRVRHIVPGQDGRGAVTRQGRPAPLLPREVAPVRAARVTRVRPDIASRIQIPDQFMPTIDLTASTQLLREPMFRSPDVPLGARLLNARQFQGGARLLDPKILQGGAQLIDPQAVRALVAAEFDPVIAAARADQAQLAAQGEQNLHDIGQWYGQVLQAARQAAERSQEMNQAGQASLQQINQAVLSSLGGAGNEAAATIAAAGQNNLGTLAAIGAINEQFSEQLQPLLQAESAAASSRERARQSQLAAEAAQRIQELMSERAAAQLEADLEVRQINNAIREGRLDRRLGLAQINNAIRDARTARLLDIAMANNAIRDTRAGRAFQLQQYENELAQQRFQNQLALDQAKIAAATLGARILESAQRAQGRQQKPKGFAALTGPQRFNLMQDLLSSVVDNRGNLALPPAQARQVIARAMQAAGFSLKSKQVRNFLSNVYANIGL